MAEKVGMPTVSGIKESMITYGLGLGGGLVFALSSAFTGSGLIGGLLGAGLAGSIIKGSRGEAIATMLGFQTVVSSMNNTTSAPAENARRTV